MCGTGVQTGLEQRNQEQTSNGVGEGSDKAGQRTKPGTGPQVLDRAGIRTQCISASGGIAAPEFYAQAFVPPLHIENPGRFFVVFFFLIYYC